VAGSPRPRSAGESGDGLIRLWVGVEDLGDLVSDLEFALQPGWPCPFALTRPVTDP